MYGGYEIRQIPLSDRLGKKMAEEFLHNNGLRLEDVDYYAGVFNCEDEMLAGGGLQGNILKCIAVDDRLRDTGMGSRLISHLVSIATACNSTVRCFTKPSNREIFESLGFRTIAKAPQAILMEMGNPGISGYISYLKELRREGRNGIIVMNGNPFTKGHLYLIEQASGQVDNLYVIMVGEDRSLFSTDERLAMAAEACRDFENVTICHGSTYAISALTFPTYFIKEVSDAAPTQITLDLDLFATHIAPALGISVRFVGSEPADPLTCLYNESMHGHLPSRGIRVIETERMQLDGKVVSASKVRRFLADLNLAGAFKMVPSSTVPYLIGQAAANALRTELDLTPKPGLIDALNSGAHNDMNYGTMVRSIEALRPFFMKLALCGYRATLPDAAEVIAIGLEAEKAMFNATNGINTHKGALFSLGLMTVVACNEYYTHKSICIRGLRDGISRLAGQFPYDRGTHGYKVCSEHGLKGASDMAREGYEDLFGIWRPFLHEHSGETDALHRTLLLIMTTLDDTNICHRRGPEGLAAVKAEAGRLLDDFSMDGLDAMNEHFTNENLSPGGAADMLALTLFAEALLTIQI